MSERGARPRNPRIEALRLVAILGIAVFHTFQPWFDAMVDGTWDASPALRATLGLVSLLGAYGNHVFFLISGYFLVPRAVRSAREREPWRAQARAIARRALPILATVTVYAAIALGVSAWVVPMPGVSVHEAGWLVGGLEFVWVYLATVVVTPLIGLVWARTRRPCAVVCALVVAVLLVNAYIAFVSPGSDERGLLEWRKLMSAVSYLTSFLVGGALADAPALRDRAGRLLVPLALVAAAVEGAAALADATGLIRALSFKSTSALSFALAAASLARAARAPQRDWPARASGACRALARSILGFYVAQSMFSPLWRPAVTDLCASALACGEAALLAAGIAGSVVLLALLLALDQLVRLPLLRLARLS